ncbi:MAG: T9SS type A sorting domain-containing protein [Sphingobacteriales bacterium]|nr:T9SS type A sorting domain-containing protein [Sphingobacteriales bacterium]
MKWLYACIIFTFLTSKAYSNDTLDISQTVLNDPYPGIFTGISSMSLNDQINYAWDTAGTVISSHFSDTILSLTKPLGIKLFRFPGGTIGNFYHFYGNGYGIDTGETNCAPGRIGYPWANLFLRFDRKVNKNIIEYFKDEVQAYQGSGKQVGVYFRLNSHTHFYKGDLIPFSDSIQYLINTYNNNNNAFLNSNGDFYLDSTNIWFYALSVFNIQQNGLFKRIKDKLVRTPGFYSRFKENLDALEYLKRYDIPVQGVEIGNETDADYIIYDDDLSYSGYDCVTNTTRADSTTLVNFPIRNFFEGLLKNWILVSLYADSIKARYNLPCGVPAAVRLSYLQPDSNHLPILIKPYGLTGKVKDLWNAYYGLQPNVSALIPHLYFQNFISCEDYAAIPEKKDKYIINKLTELYIKAYCNNSMPYSLQSVFNTGNHKQLWVTEWNFTDQSYATGTFLHALYIYHFIRKSVELYEQRPNMVKTWMYHLLASAYYPWPLVRSGYDTTDTHLYYAQKQIMFEPFFIWSNTLHQTVKKIKSAFVQTDANITADAFVNDAAKEIYIQFVNTDTLPHALPLYNRSIRKGNQLLLIESGSSYIADADNFTSTGFSNCEYINQTMDENGYRILPDTLTQFDSLVLPGLSMGKYTLHYTNAVTSYTAENTVNQAYLYPNPVQGLLHIIWNRELNNQHAAFCIFNTLGEMVFQSPVLNNHTTLNTSFLSPGFYSLQIVSKNQIIENHKIIIN